jgi:ribosome-associated protein
MFNENMEELQEKSLHRETATIEIAQNLTPFSDLDEEVKLALHCASEKKAANLTVIDLREIASFTEFFVVASGGNQRQVQAISDEINEQLKKQLDSRPVRIEGYASGEWILLDYGDLSSTFSRKTHASFTIWNDCGVTRNG